MKDIARAVFAVTLAGVILALVIPAAIFGNRLADTWTRSNTESLLGGALAICGAGAVIVALMVGAGLFVLLAGRRRREDPMPPPIIMAPPMEERPQLPAPPLAPPWGLTGGGQFELLPPPAQDRRYAWTAPPAPETEDHRRETW